MTLLNSCISSNCCFVDSACETVHLRLGLEPMGWDVNPAKTQTGTRTHGLLIEITHLVSGLNEAQVLDVSSQEGFSERKSDK